jgi:hypothetical protein
MKIVWYAVTINKFHTLLGQIYGYDEWWSVTCICALRRQDGSTPIGLLPISLFTCNSHLKMALLHCIHLHSG